MKTRIVAALLAAIALCTGCQKKPETPAPADPAPGTLVEVVSGMQNEIFTAQSGSELKLTEGTTAEPVADSGGNVRSVSMARDNSGGLSIDCACGAGCNPGGAAGCIIQFDDAGGNATCGGICEAPNMSCGSCRFWFSQPATGSVHAKWVKRKDVVAQPKP